MTPIKQTEGASNFLAKLKSLKGITLSIATGGWHETAQLKLKSADIDISGIHLSSSSEHYDRVVIMRLALSKSHAQNQDSVTYFGDGEWDRKACSKLGYNFVLIGNKTEHHQKMSDFNDVCTALGYIGL